MKKSCLVPLRESPGCSLTPAAEPTAFRGGLDSVATAIGPRIQALVPMIGLILPLVCLALLGCHQREAPKTCSENPVDGDNCDSSPEYQLCESSPGYFVLCRCPEICIWYEVEPPKACGEHPAAGDNCETDGELCESAPGDYLRCRCDAGCKWSTESAPDAGADAGEADAGPDAGG